jgi:hypothetical protein
LQTGDFILISGILGTGTPNPNILNSVNWSAINSPGALTLYRVVVIDENNFNIAYFSANGTEIGLAILPDGGTYLGQGRIEVRPNMNIMTKVFSPFYEEGGQARLGYVDFFLDNAPNGQVECDVYVNEGPEESMTTPESAISYNWGTLGNNVLYTSPENTDLYPYQQYQKKIWHRFFVESIAQNFQIQLSLSDSQMAVNNISAADFRLHALAIYLSKNARLAP